MCPKDDHPFDTADCATIALYLRRTLVRPHRYSTLTVQPSYDYIIAGAGCAGLSLALRLLESGLKGKSVLLVDKDLKNTNDRTWCFWEKGEGLFQPIVYKQWQGLLFYNHDFSTNMAIQPYSYKLIRGIDFYQYCFEKIKAHPNFHFLQGDIKSVFSTEEATGIVVNGHTIFSQYVFNSLYQKLVLSKGMHWMWQHFKGWVIESEEPNFNPAKATLMDFRTHQRRGTCFFYVLPFTTSKALVEYTVFSNDVLPAEQYDAALKYYIERQLGIATYRVAEQEFGMIPMSNYPFPKKENKIVHIGTAGGQTKGSSGYTFQFIQKETAAIVKNLEAVGNPFHLHTTPKRFHFYDSVLLEILQRRSVGGHSIFTKLFQKNQPQKVLKFLDNETSLIEDVGILRTLPLLPFSKAALRQLFRHVG